MNELAHLTEDQLVDLLQPLTNRINEFCDMYESGDFGVLTESQMDAEILEISTKMLPIQTEICRRHPTSHDYQQAYRDARLYHSRLRGQRMPEGG